MQLVTQGSYWPAIAITGAIALVASLSAVFIKERFDRRRAQRERQQTAYQGLATAVRVVQARTEVLRSDVSPSRSLVEAIVAAAPFLIVVGLTAVPAKLWPDNLTPVDIANLSRFPQPYVRFDVSYRALIDALTEVVEARTQIEVVGSSDAKIAADDLVDACVKFITLAGRRVRPWSAAARTKELDEQRDKVGMALRNFLSAAAS